MSQAAPAAGDRVEVIELILAGFREVRSLDLGLRSGALLVGARR